VQGLQPLVSAEGVLDAIDFTFVPWGNAYFNTSSCGVSEFSKDAMFCWVKECNVATPADDCFNSTLSPILCQHGDDECKEDTIEGCAFAVADDQKDALAFLYCFEGIQMSDLDSVDKCAQKSNIDATKLHTCANGEQGQQIDIKNAVKTTKLGSTKLGTPWVVVNGEYVQDPMKLLSSVCDAISGDKPPGCSNL
jgi:hypothetical protein